MQMLYDTSIILPEVCCRHHPDISDLPSAEQDFVRIQEAYEMLTKRKEALNLHAASPGEGWDFHDW